MNRRWRSCLALLGVVAGAACTEVGTNPNAPVAIELLPPASPSVVLGDTLRDSLGMAAPLRVVVFNYKNDTIAGPAPTFLVLDTSGVLTVDRTLGIVVGTKLGQQIKVVATVGSLQSIPDTLTVVDTPSVMLNVDSLRGTIDYSFAGGLRDTTALLRVRLLHLPDSVAVPQYVVHYTMLHPTGLDNTDSTNIQLVNPAGLPALVDTTDASGTTKLGLRITPFTHPFADSVVLEARAATPPGYPVLAPIRYVLQVTVH